MKGFQDFVVAVLMVASAQAAGSGPYLPSGWRPEGPAFLLPGEIKESSTVSLKSVQESVAGSDSLREYGPPKYEEILQDITQQALPDETAGLPFSIIRGDIHEDIKGFEVITEQENEDETLGTTEATVEIKGKSLKLDSVEAAYQDNDSEPEVKPTEKIADIKADNDSVTKTDSTVTQTEVSVENESDNVKSEETADNNSESETVNEAQVKSANVVDAEANNEDEQTANANNEALVTEQNIEERKDSRVNNIAEALVNLEKEIKEQQDQEHSEVKKVADIAGTGQSIPEGFLEYGPPGFKEYGPPPVSKVVQDQPSTSNEINNEVRRRRFSPKFKTISSKKH